MALDKQQIPYELLVRWGTNVRTVLNPQTGKYELRSGHVGQHVAYCEVIFDDESGVIETVKQGAAKPVKESGDFPLSDILNEAQQNALRVVEDKEAERQAAIAEAETERNARRVAEAERDAAISERDLLRNGLQRARISTQLQD